MSYLSSAAGCGSSGSGDSGKSPLDNALGYIPKSAPIVFALDTDQSDSQWTSLTANMKKFPFANQVTDSLKSSINQSGLDYDKDIKPLLGNDFVISLPTVQGTVGGNTQAVGAVQVKDKGKLSDLLSHAKDLTKDGSSGGATLYKGNGSEVAQDGDVLVVANTKQQVTAAIEQRGRDDRLTEDTFNNNLSGLPTDALVRVYVDAQGLINGSPEHRDRAQGQVGGRAAHGRLHVVEPERRALDRLQRQDRFVAALGLRPPDRIRR